MIVIWLLHRVLVVQSDTYQASDASIPVAPIAFSLVMTFSVMFQCLAVVLLGMQSLSTNSASGISAQALVLEAVSLSFRLLSTVWLEGYFPTGDFLF